MLVAARLDLVAREREVWNMSTTSNLLGSVRHEPLEMRACLGLALARVKVAVLIDQLQVVLLGEAADALALRVGGEALALLLG